MMPIPNSIHACASISSTRSNLKRTISAAVALAMISGLTAHAASATWSGAAANANWSTGGTGGNWGTSAAPGSTAGATGTSTDIATFGTVAGNSTTVNIDSNAQNIGGIAFSGALTSQFTIGASGANAGNSLFLTSGGVINLSSSNTTTALTQTINAPLVLLAATNGSGFYSFQNNTGTNGAQGKNSLVINGNVSTTATGSMTLQLQGSSSINNTNTINGIISDGTNGGTLGIISSSGADQTWVLAGQNTYTGGTTITSGTVVINADSGLGADPTSAQANNVVIAGSTLNATALTNPGTVTLNANRGIEIGNAAGTVLTGTITAGAGTNFTINGSITNADASVADTLSLGGSGTITLGGAVLNTSNAAIIAGTTVSNGGSIGSAALTMTNGTFLLNGSTSVSGGIIDNAGNIANSGNVTLSGGAIAIGSASTLFFNVANGSTLTVSNNITGAGGSIGSSALSTGTVQLTGNNTYSGFTKIGAVSGGGAQFVLDVDGNSNALGSSTVLFQWFPNAGIGLYNSSTTGVTLQNNVQAETGQNFATGAGGTTGFLFGGAGNITMEGSDTILGFNTTSGGPTYNGTATLTFAGTGGAVATSNFYLSSTSGNSGLTTFTLNNAAGSGMVIDNNIVDTSTTTGSEISSVSFIGNGKGTSTFTLAGNNSYSGSTTLTGSATFIISGSNTTSAPISLVSGVLDINSATALGTSVLNLSSGSTIDNTTSAAITVSNNVTLASGSAGGSSFIFGGTKNLTFGTLTPTNTLTTGTITLNGTGSDLTFSNLIENSSSATTPGYALTVNGAGNTLTLNSIQLSATGNTVQANDSILGSGFVVIGGFTNGGSTTPSNFSYTGTGTATINTTGLTGTLTAKGGTGGTVILSSSTGGSGAVTLAGGTLDVNNNGALGSAVLNLGGTGTLNSTASSAVTAGNNATFSNGGTNTGTFTYGGTQALALGSLNLATNFATGTITLAGTGLSFTNLVNNSTSATPSFTLTVNGAGNSLSLGTIQLSATGNTATATDIVGGSGNVVISGFTNGGSTAASSFTYNGTGAATVANASGMTGSLTEKTGTMILSGDNTGETGSLSLIGGALDINNAKALTTTAVNNFGAISTASTAATFDNTTGTSVTETLNPQRQPLSSRHVCWFE